MYRSHRIAVAIPALNEDASIAAVLDAVPAFVDRTIVVDNGSTDRTAAVAAAKSAEVVTARPRGYGTAVLAGMRALQAHPPDVLVILDADLADVPSTMAVLLDPIVEGRRDLVLSERSRTAEPGALTWVQRFGNGLAVRLMYLATGHRFRDMGPFRAIRWRSLQALAMQDPTWGWNVEMQMKALHHGLRIEEIPLPYRARTRGRSKISGSLQGASRAGVRILQAVGRYARPHR